MSKAIEEMREQAVREYALEVIGRMLNDGMDAERIQRLLKCSGEFVLSVQEKFLHAAK